MSVQKQNEIYESTAVYEQKMLHINSVLNSVFMRIYVYIYIYIYIYIFELFCAVDPINCTTSENHHPPT